MTITILLIVLIAEVAVLIWRIELHNVPSAPFLPSALEQSTPPPPASEPERPGKPVPLVELLRRGTESEWTHHSWRPAGHPDISEALATPGLAVRGIDGVVEGNQ